MNDYTFKGFASGDGVGPLIASGDGNRAFVGGLPFGLASSFLFVGSPGRCLEIARAAHASGGTVNTRALEPTVSVEDQGGSGALRGVHRGAVE